MSDINDTWKKKASAVLADSEAELAFMKLATRTIEDKASPLMSSNFYLGFEIVYNNNSNTRMVGIFAFRVNKQLLYVPVFYIEGSIKGTDLLYLQKEKLFTLLNPEWCNYIINKYDKSSGTGVSAEQSNSAKQEIDMRWLAQPPYMTKGASVKNLGKTFGFHEEDVSSEEEDVKKTYESFFKTKLASEKDNKLLQRFIKKAGFKALDKIASAVENDYDFACNIVELLETEDWMPSDVIKEQEELNKQIKTAKEREDNINYKIANAKDCILVHKGRFNPFAKNASDQIIEGLTIEDRRDASKFDPVYLSETSEYKSIDLTRASVAELLGSDGSKHKCVIFPGGSDGGTKPVVIIDLSEDNKILSIRDTSTKQPEDSYHMESWDANEIKNFLVKPIYSESWESYTEKSPEPTNQKAYGIYSSYLGYVSNECFLIKNKKVEDDITIYTVIPFYSYEQLPTSRYNDVEITIRVNPNALKSSLSTRTFRPQDIAFFPVKLKPLPDTEVEVDNTNSDTEYRSGVRYVVDTTTFTPSTIEDYNAMLSTRDGIENSEIVKSAYDKTYQLRIKGYDKYPFLNKVASKVKLMHDLNISESTANALLDKADKDQKAEFYHKKIAVITLNPEPDFYESIDTDLGVNLFNNDTKVVTTSEAVDKIPDMRYGDSIKPEVDNVNGPSDEKQIDGTKNVESNDNNIILETASPNLLAEIAKRTGNKSIFEHGIIGTYAKTFDASSYITEFMPDLRQGLDKIGRLLFLEIWKSENFLELYGSDDLIELENKLTSNFKQLGDIILELLLKIRDNYMDNNVSNNKV